MATEYERTGRDSVTDTIERSPSKRKRRGSTGHSEHTPSPIRDKPSASKRARHARNSPPSPARGSKFREGSMNDSMRTPAAPRQTHFHNDPSQDMDALMDDYHHNHRAKASSETNAMPDPADSTASTTASSQMPTKTKQSSVVRFGRRMAASFNPVNVWKAMNKTWDEAKEDLTAQNINSNRKNAEYDPHLARSGSVMSIYPDSIAPTVSARVTFEAESTRGMVTPARSLASPFQPEVGRADTLDSHEHRLRTSKSLFHIRKPSASKLKRVASGFGLNLTSPNVVASQDPTSQPTGNPLQPSGQLRHSHSRHDLVKLDKLTKRVSLQELKLEQARRDLFQFTETVSPVPADQLHYERYTPRFARARPTRAALAKPLPSLPSESLLQPDDMDNPEQQTPTVAQADPEPATSIDKQDTKVVVLKAAFRTPEPVTKQSTSAKLDSPPVTSTEISAPAKTANKPKTSAKKSKKRKSNDKTDKTFKPDDADLDSDENNEIVVQPKPKRARRSTDKPHEAVATVTESADDGKLEVTPEANEHDHQTEPQAVGPKIDGPDHGSEALNTILENETLVIKPMTPASSAVTHKADSPMEDTASTQTNAKGGLDKAGLPAPTEKHGTVSGAKIANSPAYDGLVTGTTSLGSAAIIDAPLSQDSPDFAWPEYCF